MRISAIFFQESGSLANSFRLFSRNLTSYTRARLFSKFQDRFFGGASSLANSSHFFARNSSLLKIPSPSSPERTLSCKCRRCLSQEAAVFCISGDFLRRKPALLQIPFIYNHVDTLSKRSQKGKANLGGPEVSLGRAAAGAASHPD